jgi:hypothetical protein
MRHLPWVLAVLGLAACAADPAPDEDLGLGDVSAEDMKADGVWGSATTCKPIPSFPALAHPEIFVSIDGLTLRLVDRAAGFEKVFPIGPGKIDAVATSSTFGESLSMFPLVASGKQDFVITKAGMNPCKIWWTDPETKQQLPVFAGLPFLSWSGSYGMHGPIDNYRAPNGGSLRRGYVSHGCLRMESADILELYARVKNAASVPVHVQREPERSANGDRLDVPSRWVGEECDSASDCGYTGAVCHANALGGRGFCSTECTRSCSDRAGYPMTFCIPDPDAAGKGMCVPKAVAENFECRPYDHLAPDKVGRFSQPTTTATVCAPGSRGWVGDRCYGDEDCRFGAHCAGAAGEEPGLCTVACTRYCTDQPGWADTFCVDEAALGGPTCMRKCTPGANAPECPAGTACVERGRSGQATVKSFVCEPL